MPHPIPIIIGTTIAAVGSVYCFKKFVYDPHLAPFIEALIAQHRIAPGYTPVSSPPVASQPTSGRSSALEPGTDKLRRRHAAEMYELDETRILGEERDLPYAVRKRRTARSTPQQPTAPTGPEREKTSPLSEKAAEEVSEKAEEEEKALIGLESEAQPAVESSREQETVPELEPSTPTASSGSAQNLGASSELHMPMPQAARQSMPQILQYEAPLSPSTVSSVLSSPQFVGSSEMGDDDVISMSGASNNTASYVDAETYTPRTISPFDFSVVSSRAMSPQEQQGFAELGLAQVISQSSAGWDEVRGAGSDSEWEVLSDRR